MTEAVGLQPQAGLRPADYAALIVYLLGMVAIGLHFARKGRTTEDFFLAGRRIPWWAATLSIFSTQLSAITFMAIPGKAFAENWVSILMNLGIVLVAPIVVVAYLPFFRRLRLTTAYEYLEWRFDLSVRLYGSAAFIVYQLGRMGIVLFLPSLALATVTGLDVYLCIGVMGILCVVYTALGGIEAVIWTDVLQAFVLVGGALLCLVLMATQTEGGFTGLVLTAVEHDKLHVFDTAGGLTSTVFWVVIIGGFFTQLIPFTTDQSVVQRYLTTRDEPQAARAVWTHAALVVPSSLLFFGLGSALFAFYHARPELLPPAAASSDVVFPWFIANQLPAGVSGLVIAGLFAATMSSVDSSINSVATTLVTDFFARLRPGAADRSRLRLARQLTVIVGAFATLTAVLIGYFQVASLWDLFLKNAGLLGSSLAGVFILGIFTRRASPRGALVGAAASIVALFLVQQQTPPVIHGYLYAVVGIGICVIVGYGASWLFPSAPPREGLTLGSLRALQERAPSQS